MLHCWQGGMAGVIMRLRQDGHDELQLHGPSGWSTLLFIHLLLYSSGTHLGLCWSFSWASVSFLHDLSGMYAVRCTSQFEAPSLIVKAVYREHGGRHFAV